MTLSRARDRVRKRIERAEKLGKPVQLPSNFSCLPVEERKRVLAEVALHSIETPVTAGQKVAAIKEINLMEHVYDVPASQVSNTQINIIVSSDKAKELSEKVAERLLNGNGHR